MSRIEYFVTGGSEIHLSIDTTTKALSNMEVAMIEAADAVYAATHVWWESEGEGAWPPLAESTVQRKASQGLAEPDSPLYATGTLYESVTSRHGPRGFFFPGPHSVVFGVDWYENGYSIPDVLAMGRRGTGRGGHTDIPARPIWPSPYSTIGMGLMETVGLILLRHLSPRFPGMKVASGGPGAATIVLGGAGQGG